MKTKHTGQSEQLQIKSYDRRNRGKIDTPNTHVNDLSLSCLGTGTSTKMVELNYGSKPPTYKDADLQLFSKRE